MHVTRLRNVLVDTDDMEGDVLEPPPHICKDTITADAIPSTIQPTKPIKYPIVAKTATKIANDFVCVKKHKIYVMNPGNEIHHAPIFRLVK